MSERVLTRLGIPNERVDPAALFPSVNADDLATIQAAASDRVSRKITSSVTAWIDAAMSI